MTRKSKQMKWNFVSLIVKAGSVRIVNPNYPNLADALNKLRKSELFCDVALEVPDDGSDSKHSLKAHACVLAASSKVMESVLDPEAKLCVVSVKTLSKDVMSLCLDYIYGQKICLKYAQVKELKAAAQILQIPTLEDQCSKAQERIDSAKKESTSSVKEVPEAEDKNQCTYIDLEVSGASKDTGQDSNAGEGETSVIEIIQQAISESEDPSPKTVEINITDPVPSDSIDTDSTEKPTSRKKPATRSAKKKASYENIPCDHCGKSFRGERGLRSHLQQMGIKQEKPSLEEQKEKKRILSRQRKYKEYTCPQCDQHFIGYRKFYFHKQEVHGETTKSGEPGKLFLNRRKKMRCDHCGELFSGLHGLKLHMKRVEANPNFVSKSSDKIVQKMRRKASFNAKNFRTYECPHCHEKFYGWRNWYVHKKLVHDKTYVCQFCSKVFPEPGLLKTHEQRHKKEMNFLCEYCNFGAVTKPEIDEHIKRHHISEEHICSQCPRVFKSLLMLKRHEREHHTASLKQCLYCDYTGTKANLRKHVLNKHFPDQRKMWQCTMCTRSYTQKGHLDRHLCKAHQTKPTPLPRKTVNKAIDECIAERDSDLFKSEQVLMLPMKGTSKKMAQFDQKEKHMVAEVVEEYPEEEMLLIGEGGSVYRLSHVQSSTANDDSSDVHMASDTYF